MKGGITVDGQGSGWFSISTRNPSGTYGERIRVNSSGNLIVDAGGDAQDIQIKSHSASGGHGQIYLRGNASNESSSIKLNHYGHADFLIAAGRSGNGLFSITRTDGGTDGIIVNGSGNVGINTNENDDKLHVNDGNIFQEQTNGLIFFGKDGGGSNTNSPNTHWIGRIDNAGYHAVGSDGGFSGVAGSLGIGSWFYNVCYSNGNN